MIIGDLIMHERTRYENTGESIELIFSTHWKYIAITRQFIQNFLMIGAEEQDKADHFSTAISELLENAVKYSIDKKPFMFVHVDTESDKRTLTGIVENYATPKAIEALKELYSSVMEGTPMEAYVNQMKLAATRDDGKSQLGLARIRFEAGANISLHVSEDNLVSIKIVLN
jgi:hypothetical protein